MDDSTLPPNESHSSNNNFFYHFSKPFTDSIDNGSFFKKPISWLYSIIAYLILFTPFWSAFIAIDQNYFKFEPLISVIVLIVLLFVCFILFQIWINRKNQLLNFDGEKGFVSTTIMSNFISTLGECYGVVVAVFGFVFSLLSLITGEFAYLTREFSNVLPIGEIGLVGIIIFPVLGFVIVITFRFFSELIMGIAQIARNTAN